jgi:outer membrane biosynthesis protein TonB
MKELPSSQRISSSQKVNDSESSFDSDAAYRRRIWISILVSFLINFGLLWVFLVSNLSKFTFQPSRTDKKKQPMQMVLIKKKPEVKPLPEAAAQKPRIKTFLETDASQASPEAPHDAKFYSEHNTLAAQPNPSPIKSNEIPKADGQNTKTMNTETVRAIHKPSSPSTPAQQTPPQEPAPVSKPATQPPQVASAPKAPPVQISKSGDLALLRETPPIKDKIPEGDEFKKESPKLMTPTAPRAPPTPPSSLNEAREVLASKSKLEGGVDRTGHALGFNSEASPFASYDKKIISKINSYWQYQVVDKFYGEKVGEVEISFKILSSGQVAEVEVVSNTANSVLAGWCVRAIQESAPFDPFPEAMRAMQGDYREALYRFYY